MLLIALTLLPFTLTGCLTSSQYRKDADKVAKEIIKEKQEQVLGSSEDFSIERPSDILRRRLLIEQDLPYAGEASLGTDRLTPVDHWPEKDYPKAVSSPFEAFPIESGRALELSLIQALQVGAQNSLDYQTRKEPAEGLV